MIDHCGRVIDHLRLSLTDHCNLACRYCVPMKQRTGAGQMIDAEFAFRVVEWLACDHGIRHVRLTGGEPLLYPRLESLVSRLSRLNELDEITLTTNGQGLATRATALRQAGLGRINISLDTLHAERFAFVTRGGRIAHTVRGIEAAITAGLVPVKINVVVQRGINDDELVRIAEWGLRLGCVVRFLEVMPIGPMAQVFERHLVPAAEILGRLAAHFVLCQMKTAMGQPSTDYAVLGPDLRGVIGIVASTTRPFCSVCRRIRITSQGWLVSCLHDQQHYDLAPNWDGRRLQHVRADELLNAALCSKPAVGPRNQNLAMLTIGG